MSAGYLHPHRCPLTEAAAAATVCTLALSHFMNVRHGRGGRVKEDRRHVSFKYQNEDLILMIIHIDMIGFKTFTDSHLYLKMNLCGGFVCNCKWTIQLQKTQGTIYSLSLRSTSIAWNGWDA